MPKRSTTITSDYAGRYRITLELSRSDAAAVEEIIHKLMLIRPGSEVGISDVIRTALRSFHRDGEWLDAVPPRRGRQMTPVPCRTKEVLQPVDVSPPPPPKDAYGYEVTYRRHDGKVEKCHYRTTERGAKRKAMLRPLAETIVGCEPYTEEQWVRTFGRGRM